METSQPCPNGLTYLVQMSKTNGNGGTQYCQGGSVTRLDLLDQSVVSLQVKPKTQIESVLFQASAGPLSKKLLNTNLLEKACSNIILAVCTCSYFIIQNNEVLIVQHNFISWN